MRGIALLTLALALPAAAAAQDSGADRLRQALRDSVTQMRAAQDQASQAQAQLAQAQADLAALKAKFAADEAKLAQYTGKDAQQAKQAEAALEQARAQNGALQQSLSKYQGAVQQAQEVARTKDAERSRAEAGMRANTTALATCKATNARLIDISEKVLNLWQDRSFLWVLRKSYEPLVGASRVDLENLIQDYDDKIRAQEYIPPHNLKN